MINIISSCTNSKKQTSLEALKIENFNAEMYLGDVIQIWNRDIEEKVGPKYKAIELYKGCAWQASLDTKTALSNKFKTDLYVASAGYGLIHSETKIFSYDSTFASSTSNSLSKFINTSKRSANVEWWNSINSFSVSSFPKESYFFIVLPHEYLIAAQDTIEQLIEIFNSNVFIFTANKHSIPSFMKNNIIKFDSRFNNFQTGVISNMLQRAVSWLSSEIVEKNIQISHKELQRYIESQMAIYEVFKMPIRTKLTEEEICENIKKMITNELISSATHGLRRFRKLGFACEQKRFGKLYKQMKSELA